ncbi:MAG: hypothetical protein RI992_454 [Actinomycetota bacterium]|jgi:DNA-binding response OmpR family regulator
MTNNSNEVLLVDQDLQDKSIIENTLSHMGLKVFLTPTPSTAPDLLSRKEFRLVFIGDFGDPNTSLDLVRIIRDKFDTPIIVLIDREKDLSEISFFKAGADDYVTKPINDQILYLRVNQQLNKFSNQELISPKIQSWEELSLDGETCDFWINNKYVPLTRTEFHLLSCLLSNPDRVFTRPQLLEAMKVGDGIGSDHLIDTHLSRLRIKIRDYGGGNYIYAVRGIGIRLSNPNVQNNQLRSHQNA